MIKIDLCPPDDAEWPQWIVECDQAKALCEEQKNNGEKPKINRKVYSKENIKNKFFFSKEGPFHGKCVYCESLPHPKTLDHFRPHSLVEDINGKEVMIQDASGNWVKHPGYYWLAYDWHNLLPSCTGCNQRAKDGDRVIGKGSRFPVQAEYASNPSKIGDEIPLLINPASGKDDDDPELHFSVDIESGIILSDTDKGKTTIEIFGLNERDALLINRRSTVTEVRNIFIKYIDGQITAEKLKEYLGGFIEGKKPYSFVARKLIKEMTSGFLLVIDQENS